MGCHKQITFYSFSGLIPNNYAVSETIRFIDGRSFLFPFKCMCCVWFISSLFFNNEISRGGGGGNCAKDLAACRVENQSMFRLTVSGFTFI